MATGHAKRDLKVDSNVSSDSKDKKIIKVLFTEEDFKEEERYPLNSIEVTLSGPRAASEPFAGIQKAIVEAFKKRGVEISEKEISNYYRYAEPFKVFVPIPEKYNREQLLGITIVTNNGTEINFFLPGKTYKKIFLSYVPPDLTETGWKKITETLTNGDESKLGPRYLNIQNRLDRHLLFIQAEEEDIPHYIEMIDQRTKQVHTILVTTPGRYPVCQKCGEHNHATMKCQRGKQKENNKITHALTKPTTPVETENTQEKELIASDEQSQEDDEEESERETFLTPDGNRKRRRKQIKPMQGPRYQKNAETEHRLKVIRKRTNEIINTWTVDWKLDKPILDKPPNKHNNIIASWLLTKEELQESKTWTKEYWLNLTNPRFELMKEYQSLRREGEQIDEDFWR